MKKLLFLLAALVLALTITACGSNDEPQATPTPQPVATPAPTDTTPTPAPAVEPTGWNPFPDGFPDEWEEFHETFARFNETFPPEDLGGITVRINHPDPDLVENEAAREAAQFRRDWVNQSFNINLEFVFAELDAIEWGTRAEHIISTVIAGDPIVHIFNATNLSTWFPQLVANNVVQPDSTGWFAANFPSVWWEGIGSQEGVQYAMESNFPPAASMSLAYNRELVQRAGMARTPSEMFVDGDWNFESFYQFMSDLAPLLPDDVEMMIGHPWHHIRGFAHANGGFVKHPDSLLPHYLEEPFLEAARLMQRIHAGGFYNVLNWDGDAAEGEGAWIHAAPAGVTFNNGNVIFDVLQRWQFGGASTHVEWGIVPYPWGSNVAWPASGDWRDLANNGYRSFMADGNLLLLLEGAPAALTHQMAAYIHFSFAVNELARSSYVAHAAGDTSPVRAPNVADVFEDIDRDLWQWFSDLSVLCGTTAGGQPPNAFGIIFEAIATNTDIRPAFDAVLGQDIMQMYDLGRISRADIPAAMWARAEEFNVWLAEQEEEDEE